MTNGDLAAALRSIPGVQDAEIGDEVTEHEGVRVRLTSDADPNAVAQAVRAILADRGLRSRMAPPRTRVEPPSAPPPPMPVRGFPSPSPESVDESEPEDAEGEGPEVARRVPAPEIDPDADKGIDERAHEDVAPAGGAAQELKSAPPEPPAALHRPLGGIASLRLEEDRFGVTITAVAQDGTAAVRKSRANEDAIHRGVVAAVSALFDPQAPAPAVVAIEESLLGGEEIVTVVLDDSESNRLVGASVVGAERAFAIARATFAAFADR